MYVYFLETNPETSKTSVTITFSDEEGTSLLFGGDHPMVKRAIQAIMDADVKIEDGEDATDVSDNLRQRLSEMLEIRQTVGTKLTTLCEDVTYDGKHIYFRNEHLDSTLANLIVSLLREDNPKWKSLANFLNKAGRNPSPKSVESLFDWIRGRNLTITSSGNFIAYKGVMVDSEGVSRSIHAGPGIVDGVVMEGNLPNREGSTVEMARNSVDSDSTVGCSVGLHAGTWEYAHGFARGRVVKVEINPEHVVSVPDDCEFQKLRVWKYVVLEETDAPETIPVVSSYEDEDEEDYDDEGYDDEGYDDEGYDADGYDADGYDREGYDESGYDREGYDDEGYDESGYDEDGYDEDGYDRNGDSDDDSDDESDDDSDIHIKFNV